jgi:hypothetical protein
MTETCHLLGTPLSENAAERFIASAPQGAFQVFELQVTHLPRVAELMRKHRESPMDLVDASPVILAEEQGDSRILSTDVRDFHMLWPDVVLIMRRARNGVLVHSCSVLHRRLHGELWGIAARRLDCVSLPAVLLATTP